MMLVAVDAQTGELAAFDRDSGVDLVDAGTASTAMPGLAPTHNINGTRYINGGVRSAENAVGALIVDHCLRRGRVLWHRVAQSSDWFTPSSLLALSHSL